MTVRVRVECVHLLFMFNPVPRADDVGTVHSTGCNGHPTQRERDIMKKVERTENIERAARVPAFVLPDHVSMVANILDAYNRATPEQAIAGAQWYSVAHALAGALCDGDTDRGAAIIAVLSPVLHWDKNAAHAVVAARANTRRPAGVLTKNWVKAKACRVRGADLDTIVKGKKVRAFWLCIASNGTDPYAVCVDRHAVAIACGRFLDSEDAGRAVNGKRYDRVADAYRDAAALVGVSPATMQAVTWVVWRDTPWRQRPVA